MNEFLPDPENVLETLYLHMKSNYPVLCDVRTIEVKMVGKTLGFLSAFARAFKLEAQSHEPITLT